MASLKKSKIKTLVKEGCILSKEIKDLERKLDPIKDELKEHSASGDKLTSEAGTCTISESVKGSKIDVRKAYNLMEPKDFFAKATFPVTAAREILSKTEFEKVFIEGKTKIKAIRFNPY